MPALAVSIKSVVPVASSAAQTPAAVLASPFTTHLAGILQTALGSVAGAVHAASPSSQAPASAATTTSPDGTDVAADSGWALRVLPDNQGEFAGSVPARVSLAPGAMRAAPAGTKLATKDVPATAGAAAQPMQSTRALRLQSSLDTDQASPEVADGDPAAASPMAEPDLPDPASVGQPCAAVLPAHGLASSSASHGVAPGRSATSKTPAVAPANSVACDPAGHGDAAAPAMAATAPSTAAPVQEAPVSRSSLSPAPGGMAVASDCSGSTARPSGTDFPSSRHPTPPVMPIRRRRW